MIMFKTGHQVLIDQEIAKQLTDILAVGTAKTFHVFRKPTGETVFMVNVTEIEYLIDMNYR